MITGLIVAAIVYGLIIWSVIAYRKRRGDDSLPRQFHSNFVVEAIYTTVPILIVAGLFLFTVLTENNVDALNRPNEVVTATAFRWGWQFSYADASGRSQGVVVRTGAISGEVPTSALASPYPQIELPLGETVQIVLLSTDVVHALYIPEFEFGRQAVPGIRNVFDFTPTELGRFRGECVQYCGLYHDQMLFGVHVVTASSFRSWLSAQQASQARPVQ